MLRPRIIPCLLVRKVGLVKTVRFSSEKYVGDPLNAVRIFNEKEVDEISVFDIDATVQKKEPDYNLIANIAAECRMPLCYGGGVKSVEQIERIISLGVEKVAISSAAIERPELISEASSKVGSQSVVVVLDVKESSHPGKFEVWTHNAGVATGIDPIRFATQVEKLGAGELVVNSIDRDGTMKGYDSSLASQVRHATSLPITILGGAGALTDIAELIREFGVIGAAAGSLFVFKGPYRAVLISYPSRKERDALIARAKE